MSDEPDAPYIYLGQICDLIDPGDPGGRTYRQVNAAKAHEIPIGSLVEIVGARPDVGARLFVVQHSRDCDRTPLYVLAMDPTQAVHREDPRFYHPRVSPGHPEDALMLIRSPRP